MMRSMTGFGRAEKSANGWTCGVEMRSVNNRFLDARVKLPSGLNALEDALRERIAKRLERGKVDTMVHLRATEGPGAGYGINAPQAQALAAVVNELETVHHLKVNVNFGDLLALRDVVRMEATPIPDDTVAGLVSETLEAALASLVAMRETEGTALGHDLHARLALIKKHMETVAPLAKQLPQQYATRLKDNLARLLEDTPLPEERILQELALYADRCDVSEELTRIQAHLDHFAQLIAQGHVVGRKLDFLTQELGREINTLGTKAASLGITPLVVEVKAELEKMREQIQNIE